MRRPEIAVAPQLNPGAEQADCTTRAQSRRLRWSPAGGDKISVAKTCGAVETGGIIDDPPDIVLKMQCIAPDEGALAVQFPDLAQDAAGEALSPRAAAEDDDIAAQERRARGEIDDRFAPQAGAVEQDRLRRQEFQPGAGPDR